MRGSLVQDVCGPTVKGERRKGKQLREEASSAS